MNATTAIIPPLPVEDAALVVEAEKLATGARIHDAMGLIGIYRNSVAGANRLAERIRKDGIRQWPAGEITDMEDLNARIAAANRSEASLRVFVANQRLMTASQMLALVAVVGLTSPGA